MQRTKCVGVASTALMSVARLLRKRRLAVTCSIAWPERPCGRVRAGAESGEATEVAPTRPSLPSSSHVRPLAATMGVPRAVCGTMGGRSSTRATANIADTSGQWEWDSASSSAGYSASLFLSTNPSVEYLGQRR